jgi:translation elongation factor EF-G
LLADLNSAKSFPLYLKTDSIYDCFLQILVATLSEEEIVLLDSDFTDSEIASLTNLQNGEYREMKIARAYADLKSVDELIERLDNIKNAQITFFTSGTTGRPKKVSHRLQSITRFVKRESRHTSDIWGFAYNPTHIAGVQVFFQALLNKNKIVRLLGLSIDEIFDAIESGIVNSFGSGIQYGYPCTDIAVTVTDIKYDPLTSTTFAFEACAVAAFDEACRKSSAQILEPVMNVDILSPKEFVGDAMSLVTQRGGIIQSME